MESSSNFHRRRFEQSYSGGAKRAKSLHVAQAGELDHITLPYMSQHFS